MGREMGIAEKLEVGDYDLRTVDFETVLIGPVTELIVDSARLANLEFRNGIPNWWLYRTVQAGDTLHSSRLRQWIVAFTIAYAQEGGVKREAYSDELATVAAWDAFHMLLHSRQMQPVSTTADALGVGHGTYRRLRNTVYARLRASMDEYWIQLGSAIRQVSLYNRRMRN